MRDAKALAIERKLARALKRTDLQFSRSAGDTGRFLTLLSFLAFECRAFTAPEMRQMSTRRKPPSGGDIIDYTTSDFRSAYTYICKKAQAAFDRFREIDWSTAARECRSMAAALTRSEADRETLRDRTDGLWCVHSEEQPFVPAALVDTFHFPMVRNHGEFLLARLAHGDQETIVTAGSAVKAQEFSIRDAQIHLRTATSHKGRVYVFVRLARKPFNVVVDVLSGRRLGDLQTSEHLRPVRLLSLGDQLVLIAWSGVRTETKRLKAWAISAARGRSWSDQEIHGAQKFNVVMPYVVGSRVMAVASSGKRVVHCQLFGPTHQKPLS